MRRAERRRGGRVRGKDGEMCGNGGMKGRKVIGGLLAQGFREYFNSV